MTSINERIKRLRDILRKPQSEMAEIMGIKQQSYYKIEAGLTKRPSPEALEKLIEKTQVNRSWLLAEEGDPFSLVPPKEEKNELEILKQDMQTIKATLAFVMYSLNKNN